MNTFSASAMISAGWETFKKRGWFFVGAFLLALVVETILSQAFNELGKAGVALGILGTVASLAIGILYSMGITNFALKAAENPASATLRDLWRPHPFWVFVAVTLLTALCALLAVLGSAVVGGILAGLAYFASQALAFPIFVVVFAVLALVSMLYIGILFMFSRYVVLTRALTPMAALKESMRITAGHREQLLIFLILSMLVNVLGFICLFVGLLVSIPVTAFATVHAYRALEQKASEPVPTNS